jgi:pimeloyl-ACP methyl ester carboxylesterase
VALCHDGRVLVFVHGAGRSGASAWPSVDRPDALVLDLAACPTVEDQVTAVASAITAPSVVVAHSYGAIPAVLAVRTIRQRVTALVLIEPALYDVARGHPAIERYIARMHDARRAYELSGPESYWRAVRPLMFGGPFDETRWADEQALAARFFTIRPPWGFGIGAADVASTRMIVVTGDWNAEYDAIAESLVAEGAEHRVLKGAQHRPQDLPGFGALLSQVVSP